MSADVFDADERAHMDEIAARQAVQPSRPIHLAPFRADERFARGDIEVYERINGRLRRRGEVGE